MSDPKKLVPSCTCPSERSLEEWTARRDASRDPCPCDGHPHEKCFCEGACSCHWEQPDADPWRESLADKHEFQRQHVDLPAPPLQFTVLARLDGPLPPPEPLLKKAVELAKQKARSDFVTLQEITEAADVLAQRQQNELPAAEMGLGRFAEPPVDPQPVPPPDAVAAFVEASVAVDRRAFTSTAEIMAAARVWCAENDALPFGPRALAEQLKRRRGVQAHSNGQRRGWRGVKLR